MKNLGQQKKPYWTLALTSFKLFIGELQKAKKASLKKNNPVAELYTVDG